MLNAINILPSYTDYFKLDDVTKGLKTLLQFLSAGFLAPWSVSGVVTDRLGRRPAIF